MLANVIMYFTRNNNFHLHHKILMGNITQKKFRLHFNLTVAEIFKWLATLFKNGFFFGGYVLSFAYFHNFPF
jgi:hypothetical protein